MIAHDPVDDALGCAEALVDFGRHDEALAVITSALADDPGDPRLHGMASVAHLLSGRNSEAGAAASRAIALAPEWDWPHTLRASALTAEARRSSPVVSRRLGQLAVASAREAARLSPYDPLAYCLLADVALAVDDQRAAGEAARRAVELAPESVHTWVTTSQVALHARDWLTAEAAAQRALAIDPESYDALNNLGVALDGAGRRREAAAIFSAAARRDPGEEAARRNVATSGLWVLRLAALLLVAPLLLQPATRGLYWLAAIASNVYISRRPTRLARLERWGIRIGLALGRSKGPGRRLVQGAAVVSLAVVFGLVTMAIGVVGAVFMVVTVFVPSVLLVAVIGRGGRRRRQRPFTEPVLAPVRRVHEMRTGVLVILAAAAWSLTLAMIGSAASSPAPEGGSLVGPVLLFGLVAVITTSMAIRRARAARRS